MGYVIRGIALVAMTFCVCGGAHAQSDAGTGEEVEAAVEDAFDDEYEDDVYVEAPTSSSAGCDTSGASVGVKGGGFGVSSPSYPCTVLRTREAIDATMGQGFIQGPLSRFFLRGRLVTKGLFSMIFGLVGLG